MNDKYESSITPRNNKVNYKIEEILRYLKLLSVIDCDVLCFSFMDLESKKVLPGCGTVQLQSLEVSEYLARICEPFTLHVCLNQTNFKGRRREHMVAPRVLCLDIDRELDRKEWEQIVRYEVNFVVETSPKRYHFYWKIDPGISLENWKLLQAGIAAKFDGDLNLAQVQHTVRVPGCERICKGVADVRFMPTLYDCDLPHKPYVLTDLTAIFPGILGKGKKAILAQNKGKKKINNLITRAFENKSNGCFSESIDTALATELGKIGHRNNSLYSILSTYIRKNKAMKSKKRLCEEVAALAQYANSHFEKPLSQEEITKTITSAITRGLEAKSEPQNGHYEEKGSQGGVSEEKRCESFKYDYSDPHIMTGTISDVSIKARIVQRYKEYLCAVGNVLYAFNQHDNNWYSQKDNTSVVNAFAIECVKDVFTEQKFKERCYDKKGFSTLKYDKETEKYLSNNRISGVLAQLKNSVFNIETKNLDDFDSDKAHLNCKNGYVNLIEGTIRAPKSNDYLLLKTKISFDASAKCPKWKQFLAEIFENNEAPEAMISFLQEVFGYSLTASIAAQKLFIHCGSGSNGKSIVLYCLRYLLDNYAAVLDCKSLSTTKYGIQKDPLRIGVKLVGKRIAIMDEVDTDSVWGEALVKSLLGAYVLSRKLFGEEEEVLNRAKFHIGCNDIPKTQSESEALLRRLCIIPYNREFTPNAAKEALLQKMIREESSGILNWAIEGLVRYLEIKKDENGEEILDSFNYPEECTVKLIEYRADNFIHEKTAAELIIKGDENNKNDWHSLNSIQEWYNKNSSLTPISIQQLGTILTSKQKVLKLRTHKNKVKATFYCVKMRVLLIK